MSKRKHKHQQSVSHGRYLQPEALEKLLHGEATPDAQIRAAKKISAGAEEAKRFIAHAKALQQGGVTCNERL